MLVCSSRSRYLYVSLFFSFFCFFSLTVKKELHPEGGQVNRKMCCTINTAVCKKFICFPGTACRKNCTEFSGKLSTVFALCEESEFTINLGTETQSFLVKL